MWSVPMPTKAGLAVCGLALLVAAVQRDGRRGISLGRLFSNLKSQTDQGSRHGEGDMVVVNGERRTAIGSLHTGKCGGIPWPQSRKDSASVGSGLGIGCLGSDLRSAGSPDIRPWSHAPRTQDSGIV